MATLYSSHLAVRHQSYFIRFLRARVQALVRGLGLVVLLASCYLLLAPSVYAEDALTLTVTPPIFQLSIEPGTTWSSTIRVVNGNAYPVTLYADPVPFTPEGESGRPRIVVPKAFDESIPPGLAGWIDVPQGPLDVQAEQTFEIPFTIRVPHDAAPGGHYAAVLIGNRAPRATGQSSISVASSIASLIFLSVAGDVDERARIRDFVTDQALYEKPEARFSLRFENQGNIHVQPRGTITIYNMFGKERGTVIINQEDKHFGNVMPGSVRKFSFDWQADSGRWDIGKYKAEATLGYGSNATSFANATTYFWVLPVGTLVWLLAGVGAFLWFFWWALRAYVRKALALEAARIGVPEPHDTEHTANIATTGVLQPTQQFEITTLLRPIERGIVDLRSITRGRTAETASQAEALTADMPVVPGIVPLLKTYRYFILFIVVVAVAVFAANILLSDVLTYEREYKVHVVPDDEQ